MENSVKQKINVLVEKYKEIQSAGKLRSYTEEETKKTLFSLSSGLSAGMFMIRMRFRRKRALFPLVA